MDGQADVPPQRSSSSTSSHSGDASILRPCRRGRAFVAFNDVPLGNDMIGTQLHLVAMGPRTRRRGAETPNNSLPDQGLPSRRSGGPGTARASSRCVVLWCCDLYNMSVSPSQSGYLVPVAYQACPVRCCWAEYNNLTTHQFLLLRCLHARQPMSRPRTRKSAAPPVLPV